MKGRRCAPVWVLSMAALLAACATPPPPAPPLATQSVVPLAAAEASPAEWPTARWWDRYGDATLDMLMTRVLREASGIGLAQTRVRLAEQSLQWADSRRRPQVDAQASLRRQQLSENGLLRPQFLGFETYSDYQAGVGLRHSLDWWGRERAAIAAAAGELQAARAEQADVGLGLTLTAAEAYFHWQTDQRGLQRLQREAQLLERWAALVRLRQAAKLEDEDALRRVELRQSRNREGRVLLEGSVERTRLAVAALLGMRPDELPQVALQVTAVPAAGLPPDASLDLLARRPDLLAARWRVEAAAQRREEARTRFYPDISLQALAGLSSIEIDRLLDGGSLAPSAGLALNLPLFDGGVRKAQLALRDLEWQAAVDSHRDAVRAAAREVGEALSRAATGQARARELRDQQQALGALRDAAAARLRAGTADERARLVAELDLLAIEAAIEHNDLDRLLADVALQGALGGGLDTRKLRP
ncbi:MAG: hypothetical protein RL026_2006 [Pseudomonadota bacterium]|jgi:multidrug efflux system outer membrane protein